MSLQTGAPATNGVTQQSTAKLSEIPGELIYEFTGERSHTVEYGISAEDLLSGQVRVPAEGARLDIHFEGRTIGPKISGTVKGVNYLNIRADGRYEIDIKAEITTKDGKKIAFAADGVGTPESGSPIVHLRQNVKLTTNHPEYSWVNQRQLIALGSANNSTGEVSIAGYAI
jgi:hypothetical protein